MDPIQQQVSPTPQGALAPSGSTPKIGKFKASNLIARASLNILMQDKEMLLFPILSTLVSLAIIGAACALYFFAILHGNIEAINQTTSGSQQSPVVRYGLLFVTYFISFFITIFFQTGIVAITAARIEGRDYSFTDGMNVAFAHVDKIALWSLVAATVGVILRAIADRSQWLGKLVIALLGAAWGIATFFIVPVLILEESTIEDSFKTSVDIVKRTWGETIILNVGTSIVFALIGFLGVVLFGLTMITGSLKVIITAAILLVALFLIIGVISSTLDVIFRVVLYRYARTGKVPDGFSEELLRAAFVAK